MNAWERQCRIWRREVIAFNLQHGRYAPKVVAPPADNMGVCVREHTSRAEHEEFAIEFIAAQLREYL